MMTTAMCPLCVLLLWALLCPGRGKVQEIFTRPGSELIFPIRIHLTLNHPDRGKCDQIEWKYKHPTRNENNSSRIFLHRGCTLRKPENTTLPNIKISENGSLIISNVTPEDDGRYSVDIYNSTGQLIQTDNYTVHVEVPVSGPVLNVSCLQDGSAEISCRVEEGTKPDISLSVIGGSQWNNSVSANNITAIVEPPGPWNITCTVMNRLNQSEISQAGVTCPVPLSDIAVNHTCFPNGSAEAECSVKGSDPRYSWSLDGRSVSSHRRVTLPPPVSGTLHCDVTNQINNLSSSINIFCAVPVSDPVLDVKCLQNGSAEISCSVEKGTNVSVNLTVSGESKVYNASGSERMVRVTVPLVSSPHSWNITCSAQNAISLGIANKTSDTCPDPLSAPRLTVSCNNNGSANVSCVLEDNEDVSYHWTVNGTSLPRNHSRNITIINEEFISGPLNVSCSVNNSVSKKESNYTNIFCLAPPSTPKVIFSCQNNGSVSVSCVLEKEQNVTYNWTVNGKVYGDHSSNVTFSKERKTVPMNVSCSVQNSASRKESNTTHISCPDQPCFSCLKKSLIGGSVALLLTMPPVFVAHWYILRGMRKKT
ncbi:uncharacterized protein LOC143981546 [Lithobates pipiens]